MKRSFNFKARRGAAAVEFSFCLMILLPIVFAAIEFNRVNILRHSVDNAAYEAARHVIVPGATAKEAQIYVINFLKSVGIRNATITISPTKLTPTNPIVVVRVEVPVASNSWVPPMFTKSKIISSTVSMLAERTPGVQLKGLGIAPTLPPPLPPPPSADGTDIPEPAPPP